MIRALLESYIQLSMSTLVVSRYIRASNPGSISLKSLSIAMTVALLLIPAIVSYKFIR